MNVQLDHEIEAVQKEMRQFAANLKSQVQFGYSEQVIDQVAVQLQLASDLPHDTLYNQPPLVSVDALQKMIDIFDENLSEVEKEKEVETEQMNKPHLRSAATLMKPLFSTRSSMPRMGK